MQIFIDNEEQHILVWINCILKIENWSEYNWLKCPLNRDMAIQFTNPITNPTNYGVCSGKGRLEIMMMCVSGDYGNDLTHIIASDIMM